VAGDSLRAYALMSVVVFHIAAGVLLLDTGAFDIEGTYGRLGGNVMQALQTSVYVFFALSAFLLSRPFVRSAVYGTPFPSVRRYARHRVGRILPAFWAIVVVILVIYGMQGSGPGELIAFMGSRRSTTAGTWRCWSTTPGRWTSRCCSTRCWSRWPWPARGSAAAVASARRAQSR